jgi:RNA polymerase sigma-70 factor (ECF subfamily)
VRLAGAEEDRIVLAAFEAHERDLYAFAHALLRDPDAAADLVGDAFVRLLAEVRAGRTPADARGWLFRVVGNLVASRGRRIATARRLLGRLSDRRTHESPEAAYIRHEVRDDLRAALAGLPTDMRVAIVMAAYGVAGRDIAAAIGRSEAATRTLLTRARQRVRQRLAAADGGGRER